MFFKAPTFTAKQYKKIINSASEGIWIVDSDGITTFSNGAMAAMLGYSVQEILGRSAFDFFLFDDATSFEPFVTGIDEGKIEKYEIKLLRKDRSHCWVLMGSSPIVDEAGDKLGSIFMITDITERKKNEKLISDQKAKIAHQGQLSALGEMASNIAHEINTPLSAIIAKLSLLKLRAQKVDTISSADLLPYLDSIEATSFRISNIIRGMRAVARSSEGAPFQLVPISGVITDALLLCSEAFKSSGVRLEIPPPSPIKVECRSVQISQVLLNLVSNAHDAIAGTESPWIKIEVIEESHQVCISVTDSGKGIPKNIANRVMEPFFTTKQVGKGTGLGLSISANIMKEHDGALVLNETCQNTQFILKLPRTQPVSREAAVKTKAS